MKLLDLIICAGKYFEVFVERNYIMAGFIYILSNPSFPGLLKIGKSNKDPRKYRAKELYGTGVPTPFNVEYLALVDDETFLEQLLHKQFSEQRVNEGREFSDLDCETAIKFIRGSPDVMCRIEYERISFHRNLSSETELDGENEFEKAFGPSMSYDEFKDRSRILYDITLTPREEKQLINERDELQKRYVVSGHWYYDADVSLLTKGEATRRAVEREKLNKNILERINEIDRILAKNSRKKLIEKAMKLLHSTDDPK